VAQIWRVLGVKEVVVGGAHTHRAAREHLCASCSRATTASLPDVRAVCVCPETNLPGLMVGGVLSPFLKPDPLLPLNPRHEVG
jgi:hypothetical protein